MQEEFFKLQIKQCAQLTMDSSKPGLILNREISYIMRYLMQFPSEAQVRDYIIVKLEDDEPSEYIKYDKLEPYLVNVLMINEFPPTPAEHLIAAFKMLDPHGTGKIKREIIDNLLKTKGIAFRDTEMAAFTEYALDKTGLWVEYEEYVAKLVDENERHYEFFRQQYEEFIHMKPKQN